MAAGSGLERVPTQVCYQKRESNVFWHYFALVFVASVFAQCSGVVDATFSMKSGSVSNRNRWRAVKRHTNVSHGVYPYPTHKGFLYGVDGTAVAITRGNVVNGSSRYQPILSPCFIHTRIWRLQPF